MSLSHNKKNSTLCIHSGIVEVSPPKGACNPIYTSTAFAFPNPSNENVYPRYFNTPNQRIVARKIADLEHAEDAIVFCSGMAAIATFLYTVLSSGDHAIFQADLYGGTYQLVTRDLIRHGIEVTFCRTSNDVGKAVRANTRLVYVESPSNPLLRCMDLEEIACIGCKCGVLTAIDNTFATPINQNPIRLGFDVVIHSATKYLNGHSDVNAGVVVSSSTLISRIAESAINYGGMLDAFACYQLERGIKTLALRMRQHNHNAMRLALFLQNHSDVACVHYPGLESHPDHFVAKRQMHDFGGMLAFELHDFGQVAIFLENLKIVMPALSLGGVESLICVPCLTSHRQLSTEDRFVAGITPRLLRISVGIEDPDDIIDDIQQALEVTRPKKTPLRNLQPGIIHNVVEQRFEYDSCLGASAFLSYEVKSDHLFLNHVFVSEELRGKGIAAQLVREALKTAQERQWKAVPVCTYIQTFFENNPEFSSLLPVSSKSKVSE
jgi:cystathionine beta-lyase